MGMPTIRKRLAIFLLLIPAIAFAQTAAEMDALLEAETVIAAVLARFVFGAADLLPPELSGPEAEKAAYDMAVSNGWVKTSGDESSTLKNTAFLVMQAFDLKGGVLYSLFGNPRYAYREMIYQKIITGHADQNMMVTGQGFLQILDRVISYTAGREDNL